MGVDAEIRVRVKVTPSDEQLKRWGYELCAAIGAQHFLIQPTEKDGGAIRHCDFGDMPSVIPGETLLRVAYFGRYYGVNYERGDILTICAIAEWCEANIPGCVVGYGGDGDSITIAPFQVQERDALRRHLYSSRGRDYYGAMSAVVQADGALPYPPVDCQICPEGAKPQPCGSGPNWALHVCNGCGRAFERVGDQWETFRSYEEHRRVELERRKQ